MVLAHPVRNQFEISEHLLGEINGLEVWNQQYEGKRAPRTRSLTLFETLRKQKPTLVATGGIDFHRASHFGAPFITINIPTLTEAHILEKCEWVRFASMEHVHLFRVCSRMCRYSEKSIDG